MAVQSVAVDHVTLAAVVVAGIQWLKNSKYFPWITAEKSSLLRALAVFAAAAAAVGISWTWDPSSHALTISGLTATGIASMFYSWLKQFAIQEFMYRATKNGSSNGAAPAAKSLTTVNAKPI